MLIMREQVLPVENFTIWLKASESSSYFCAKGKTTQISATYHFTKRNVYVYCFATCTAWHDPKDTIAEATEFMNIHCALLEEPVRDKRWVNVY